MGPLTNMYSEDGGQKQRLRGVCEQQTRQQQTENMQSWVGDRLRKDLPGGGGCDGKDLG